MRALQFRTLVGGAVSLTVVLALAGTPLLQAQANPAAPLVGAWTLNKDLSDKAPDRGAQGDNNGSRGQGGGHHHGGGGGGFGGHGGGQQGDAAADPEQAARTRQAMRDLLNPPDHLTIVKAENMMVLTGPDGRTTRLSLDGKKVKDDSTKIERTTKWDGSKLVSEIKGVGSSKITETYTIDVEHHQLRVALQVENNQQNTTINHVYDADAR
jgi:hypothetical protein